VFRVLSWNIKNPDTAAYPTRTWDRRRPYVVEMMQGVNADIMGISEATQLAGETPGLDLQTDLPNYDTVPASPTTANVIFFRRSRFAVATTSTGAQRIGAVNFPIASSTTDPCYQGRYMRWAVLKDKTTGGSVFAAVTHFHTLSACASYRVTSARMIHQTIAANNPENFPVVLMGDFNNRSAQCTDATSGQPITILAEASNTVHPYHLSSTVPLNACTSADATANHGWDADYTNDNKGAIDFIFASLKLTLVKENRADRVDFAMGDGTRASASDHYGLWADFKA
jgi:endonuclease/exonuclease/phosphatase family metal-dependent hydrolase